MNTLVLQLAISNLELIICTRNKTLALESDGFFFSASTSVCWLPLKSIRYKTMLTSEQRRFFVSLVTCYFEVTHIPIFESKSLFMHVNGFKIFRYKMGNAYCYHIGNMYMPCSSLNISNTEDQTC